MSVLCPIQSIIVRKIPNRRMGRNSKTSVVGCGLQPLRPAAIIRMQILPNGDIRTFGDTAITILGEIVRDGRKLEIGYVQQRAIETWAGRTAVRRRPRASSTRPIAFAYLTEVGK